MGNTIFVIHGSFGCVEPLTDVIHQVGSVETLGYLGAVHVWSTSVRSSPSVSEVRMGISWVPAVTSGIVGDRLGVRPWWTVANR